MSGYTPEFDWNPANDTDHSVVVRHQPAIAVYFNPHDAVVIRQQDQYDESTDHFVFITKDNVRKVVERMLEVAGIELLMARVEDSGLEESRLLPAPKDPTAVERQRRYRNKHRNGNGRDETVTRNDELPLLINGHSEEVLQAAE
jgi:hypothetical protein